MLKTYKDKKHNFYEIFNTKNGAYLRSGILDENGKDTGIDPFMRDFPGLIDIGVMGHCVHGKSGLCAKSGVQCYQNGLKTYEPNMTLENFKRIIDEMKDKSFQCLYEKEVVLVVDRKTTMRRPIEIKDVQVGDLIFTHNETFVKVDEINKKEDFVSKIMFDNGKYILATKEHKFPVLTEKIEDTFYYHNQNYVLKTVNELTVGDIILSTDKSFHSDKSLKRIDVVKMIIQNNLCDEYFIKGELIRKKFKKRAVTMRFAKDNGILDMDYSCCQIVKRKSMYAFDTYYDVNEKLMFLLGLYTAQKNNVYVFKKENKKIMKKAKKILYKIFWNFCCEIENREDVFLMSVFSNVLHNSFFNQILECKYNEQEKQLPNFIFRTSKVKKLAFLSGMFACGHFDFDKDKVNEFGAPEFNLPLYGEKLKNDVCLLLASLGIDYLIREYRKVNEIKNKKETPKKYILTFRTLSDLQKLQSAFVLNKDYKKISKFIRKNKKNIKENESTFIVKRIVQLKEKKNVVDINIASEDKLFVTSHGIMTHNCALGGRGDVDQHEQFEEILKYASENDVVPNFTSSGLGFTPEIVDICKKYCGAIAISQYSRLDGNFPVLVVRKLDDNEPRTTYTSIDDIKTVFTYGGYNKDCYFKDNTYIINEKEYYTDYNKNEVMSNLKDYECYKVFDEVNNESKNDIINYTMKAVHMLLEKDVKTNIHYVLGNNTLDEAIIRLKYNGFPKGINAVIFLLHKPVGLGKEDNVLKTDDERVKEFFQLIDKGNFPFKIGFDSCSIPGILNNTTHIAPESMDSCEGGRFSMYITSDMKAIPCSFDNQDLNWVYDISNDTIKNAWDSKQFDDFRNHFKNSCLGCKQRILCLGGCPIKREVVLCDKPEKDLQ